MLNQETQSDIGPKLPSNNNSDNHNHLNEHDYCSPNKMTAQQSEKQSSEKHLQQQTTNKQFTTSSNNNHAPSKLMPESVASTSSPDPRKLETRDQANSQGSKLIVKSYSNDDLSESSSSLSSSSDESSKDLVIAQDSKKLSKKQLFAPKDTPSVPKKRELKGGMTECLPQTTGRVRAQRARQSTSVTDKSEWITGDDQIDSVLSEHLDEDLRDKKSKATKEHDSAYNVDSPSDYSSSDAESDQNSDSEDDPNRLWCLCQKPHEGKFMIQCDICTDWYHGHCVGVTKLMGDRFEKQGKEWFCGECQEKLRSGMPRNAIPKKSIKKEKKKKKLPVPGKRGRGRPRRSETTLREGATRVSQRTTRKSSSLDPKLGVDNGRLRKNLARSDARSESFDEFEDSQRLKELIKERKKEFFYKRHLAEQQKAAKRNELGLGRQSLTANLSDSLDSLATSTSSSNLNNLPSNIKSEPVERSKPNIVLQINTKKDGSSDQNNPNSRIVTAIVRSPKKSKHTESSDSVVSDLFTAEPIQINKKIKIQTPPAIQTSVSGNDTTGSNGASVRKRSNSGSSTSKQDKSSLGLEQGDHTTPKKKRKDSESSTPNGSSTPIGSKHIVQKIKDILEARSKQIQDLEVEGDKIEKLATEIEGQLNECFKEGTQKYLNKFRSLLFNLRDPKNQSLVKNVLTGEIEPAKLVRMSPEEMAPRELAKWREDENNRSIELIKRDAQLNAAQQVIVKKTHKGEEVISAPSFTEPDDPATEADNQEPPTASTKQSPSKESRTEATTLTLTPPPAVGNTTSTGPLKIKITGITSESSPPKAETSPPKAETPPPKVEMSDQPCWSGSITVPDVPKFSASAKPVSGTVDFMMEEFRDNIMVCGRIAPDQLQGYIKQLKTTTKNQILVIQFFPLTEDDRENFDIFFDYLYSRNRYGVIQTSQQVLKDFYVLPIHEKSSIPEILKPIKGPGIDRKDSNCLLGLLVRSKKPSGPSNLATYTPTPIK